MFAFKAWKLYTMHWFAEMFLSRCVNITTRDYKDDVLEWKNPLAEILGTPTVRSGHPNHMYDVCVMAKAGNMTSSIKGVVGCGGVGGRDAGWGEWGVG